jgi:hypothetical protein
MAPRDSWTDPIRVAFVPEDSGDRPVEVVVLNALRHQRFLHFLIKRKLVMN